MSDRVKQREAGERRLELSRYVGLPRPPLLLPRRNPLPDAVQV